MTIKDRLLEMKQQMLLLESSEQQPKLWSTKTKRKTSGHLLQEFLKNVNQIHSDIKKMTSSLEEIKTLQRIILASPFQDASVMTKYESLGHQVRTEAIEIGDAVKLLSVKYDTEDLVCDGVFHRVKTQQISSLTTNLNTLTNEFFKVQSEYMEKIKSRFRRQQMAVGKPVEGLEMDAITADASYSVFTGNYISDVHNAEQTLKDLEDRKKALLALEKRISDVNHLFSDVSLTVYTQGETLDTVEKALNEAEQMIGNGLVHQGQALELQKKTRKRCLTIVIVVVVVVIVVTIITTTSLVSD